MFRNWLRSVRQAIRSLESKPFDPYAACAPKVAAALSHRGYILFQDGEVDAAIQAFNDALAYAPKSALVYNNRACAFLERCEYDLAIQDCNSALAFDPTLASAFCNRGSAYLGKLDLQRGTEDYDRCISLDPNYDVGYTNRSFASLATGDYERAIQDSDRAISLNPSYNLASRNRGIVAFCLQHFEEAKKHLAYAVELDTKAPDSMMWLLLARQRGGESQVGELAQQLALDLSKWPGPLVGLLLGSSDEQAVMLAARDQNPDKERGQLCGAYFVMGEMALINDDQDRALIFFKKSLGTGAINYLEHCAAKAELDHWTEAGTRKDDPAKA